MTLPGQIAGSRGGRQQGGRLERLGEMFRGLAVQEMRAESDEEDTRNLNFLLPEAKTLEILWPSLLFIHVWSMYVCEYMRV